MSENKRVRTRYAPSPTGKQHVGGIRSALFAYLWARHNDGDFLLRVEDTDQARFREDALQDLFDSMEWLGLEYDEGPVPGEPPNEYFQTQRAARYQEVARQLVEKGAAYYAYETSAELDAMRQAQQARNEPPGYNRASRYLSEEERQAKEEQAKAEGRKPVVRFAVPLEGSTTVHDAVRGEWTAENQSLEDMILLKSDGLPTYHLGHLVDDHDMGITHVMRGVEYVPTAPLHVLIHEALGWEAPTYVHLPLILDPSGQGKMSKRKQNVDGSETEQLTMVSEFRAAGYLPEALVNYLALLGWSVAADRDIADRAEMIEKFDIHDIKKSPAAFNYEKLDYMNGWYIRQLSASELSQRVRPFLEQAGLPTDETRLQEVLPLVQERMKLLSEAPELLDFFLADAPLPDPAELPGKKMSNEDTIRALQGAHDALAEAEWTMEALDETLRATADQLGLKAGQLFQPLRVAVTGRKFAPGIFETVYHVGRERVLERIERAIGLLQ